MQRCRELSRGTRPAPARIEAILAATMLHLESGDFCSPLPGSGVAAQLATDRLARLANNSGAPQIPQPERQRVAMIAGAALSLKLSGQGIALGFTHTGAPTAKSEQGWSEALAYATRAALPLVLVCAAVQSQRGAQKALAITWETMSRLAKSLKLPVLTVDGTDAVAIYRVMQEATHRARQGDGAAVIWCALPAMSDRTAANDPIRTLQRYLKARGLLPAAPAKKTTR